MGRARKTRVLSKICKIGEFDRIILDLPKDLHVSNVSSHPNLIPSWSAHNSKEIKALFGFAHSFSQMMLHCFYFFRSSKQLGIMLGHTLLHMNLNWQMIGGQ